MYKLKKFDRWNVSTATFGSGASRKVWLINSKTSQIGIFKYPKVRVDGTITGEFWAEKLAVEIGKLIGIKCAKVDIGTYERKVWFYEL